MSESAGVLQEQPRQPSGLWGLGLTRTSFLCPGSSWVQRHGGLCWHRWVSGKSAPAHLPAHLQAGVPGDAAGAAPAEPVNSDSRLSFLPG